MGVAPTWIIISAGETLCESGVTPLPALRHKGGGDAAHPWRWILRSMRRINRRVGTMLTHYSRVPDAFILSAPPTSSFCMARAGRRRERGRKPRRWQIA